MLGRITQAEKLIGISNGVKDTCFVFLSLSVSSALKLPITFLVLLLVIR